MKVLTSAKYQPDDIDDETWEALSTEKRREFYVWSPYAFETNEIESFNAAAFGIGTTLRFKSGNSIIIRNSFNEVATLFPDAKQL